jgi:hypothetical protein
MSQAHWSAQSVQTLMVGAYMKLATVLHQNIKDSGGQGVPSLSLLLYNLS